MIKRKIIPKFGIIFKDANIEVAGSTNLKAWDKDEQAKLKTIKPIVYIVFKNLEGYKILKFGDLIIQINKKKINNIYELLIERKKLKWNSTINFKIKRKKEYLNLKIKLNSFDHWKKNCPKLGFDVSKKSNSLVISDVNILSSAIPKFDSKPTIKTGDQIISLNKTKVKTHKDFSEVIGLCIPNKVLRFDFIRDSILHSTKIKIISFAKFIKLNRDFCMEYWPKKAAKILLREYELNDFHLDPTYKSKIIDKFTDKKYEKNVQKFASRGIKTGRIKLKNKKIKLDT